MSIRAKPGMKMDTDAGSTPAASTVETLRICTECDAPDHAENCPECFGWGMAERADGTSFPLPASMAANYGKAGSRFWKRCEICRGTPLGRSE